MALLQLIKNLSQFTQTEQNICKYLLEYPEKIPKLSSRELGSLTYSSAASVIRLCKKLGFSSFLDFKMQFSLELKSNPEVDMIQKIEISDHENIVSMIQKVHSIQLKALEETKKRLSLEQMSRICEMLYAAQYIDFYGYDSNIHIAKYACSQFFHSGKIANTYSATNVQSLNALVKNKNHLTVIISHTGENYRLIEIAKMLKASNYPFIVISSDIKSTLSLLATESLCAVTTENTEEFWSSMFFSSAKYLLDIMFGLTFSHNYKDNIKLNQTYDKKTHKLWAPPDRFEKKK